MEDMCLYATPVEVVPAAYWAFRLTIVKVNWPVGSQFDVRQAAITIFYGNLVLRSHRP
jgi:hypothetical protein